MRYRLILALELCIYIILLLQSYHCLLRDLVTKLTLRVIYYV